MDSLVYVSLGVGFFLRFLLVGKMNLVFSYVLFVGIAAVAYLIIPVTSLIFGEQVQENIFLQEVLPAVGLLVFGFCQFAAWPALLTLTSEHFDHTNGGKAMGIWSANGNLGNILGFTMTGLLVDVVNLEWQYAMITAACFNFMMILLVALFVRENNGEKSDLSQDLISSQEDISQTSPTKQN